MKTTITYTAYKNFPKATEFSRNMTFLTGGISIFGLLVICHCFLNLGKIFGIVSAIVFIAIQVGLKVFRQKKLEEIIIAEIKDRQRREERYREMNLQQQQLDMQEVED